MTTKARITVYPSEELKERIEAIAESERRSANAQILIWLEDAVAAAEGPVPVSAPQVREQSRKSAAPRIYRVSSCPHGCSPTTRCEVCDAAQQ